MDDYEIMCINDGSTDRSLSILESYAAQSKKISIINQKNSGVAAARNAGLTAAKGDYIWFVDSDDLVAENILSRLQALLHTQDCDLLEIGGYQFEGELSQDEKLRASQMELPDNVPGPYAVVWRSLIRLDFLRAHQHSFRHPSLTHGEDGQFMFELSLLEPKTACLDEPIYFYRLRPGSAETAASPENKRKRLSSHIAIAKIMKTYCTADSSVAANRLMAILWCALYEAAALPIADTRQVLASLQEDGLFPMRPPKAFSETCAYMTDRKDFVGAVFNRLYMCQHTRLGFAAMWLARHLLKK